jgi:hypothetical protein
MTNTIAIWVSKKFVSGRLDHPPLANFRSNPLIAVKQTSKVRPIFNLSAPKKKSLNDATNPAKIPKNLMSTAKFSVSQF